MLVCSIVPSDTVKAFLSTVIESTFFIESSGKKSFKCESGKDVKRHTHTHYRSENYQNTNFPCRRKNVCERMWKCKKHKGVKSVQIELSMWKVWFRMSRGIFFCCVFHFLISQRLMKVAYSPSIQLIQPTRKTLSWKQKSKEAKSVFHFTWKFPPRDNVLHPGYI